MQIACRLRHTRASITLAPSSTSQRTTLWARLTLLTASDKFEAGRLPRRSTFDPNGAVVVIAEIFGAITHSAVLPPIVSRIKVTVPWSPRDPSTESSAIFHPGYSPRLCGDSRARFVANPDWKAMLLDTQAASDSNQMIRVPSASSAFSSRAASDLRGGYQAVWAQRRDRFIPAGAIVRLADDRRRLPTQLHFGEKDHGIPLTDFETLKSSSGRRFLHLPRRATVFGCDERGQAMTSPGDIARQRQLCRSSPARAL